MVRITTKVLIPWALWFAALAVPGGQAAEGSAAVEEAVRSAIMARHPNEAPEWWRSLGPQAPSVIMRMYATESSVYRRMRLIEGLAAFADDPAAVEFIKSQADRTTEGAIRNNAIRVVGLARGAREEDWIARHLSHEDPHTRAAAAQALQKIGSASTLERVRKFMAEEKTPWIVAKLQNPKTVADASRSAPPAASPDALSADFSGSWSGFWVSPRLDQPAGMKSEPVRLSLKVIGSEEVSGTLSVKSGARSRTLTLAHARGKSSRWAGAWLEAGASSETPCEAEMKALGSNRILEIRIPKTGAVMVLRRELPRE